jgi:hypothetical protein
VLFKRPSIRPQVRTPKSTGAWSIASALPQVDGCFSKPRWLRLSRINDGVNKTFHLFVGQVVRQGASIVLLGMSPIVEISDS